MSRTILWWRRRGRSASSQTAAASRARPQDRRTKGVGSAVGSTRRRTNSEVGRRRGVRGCNSTSSDDATTIWDRMDSESGRYSTLPLHRGPGEGPHGNEWDEFRKVFRDKRKTEESLAVVTQCRNELEHFRPLPEREIMRLQVAASDLLDDIGPFVARFQWWKDGGTSLDPGIRRRPTSRRVAPLSRF